jgi:uncharacterized protein YciI
MLYAIIGQDVENSTEKRLAARPVHLQRLEALKESGRLVLAGPFPTDDGAFMGSLIVAEFDSLDAAKAWAESDPYVLDGVFEQVDVKPFRKVLP